MLVTTLGYTRLGGVAEQGDNDQQVFSFKSSRYKLFVKIRVVIFNIFKTPPGEDKGQGAHGPPHPITNTYNKQPNVLKQMTYLT